MKWFLPLLLAALAATGLGAHPFDDRADMVAEIVLKKDATGADEMLLQVQYRYESPFASYNEAVLELDENRDGSISREELDSRYRELAADIQAAVYLGVRDSRATLVPDYKEFEFANLDDRDASVDDVRGMATQNLRIGYFFLFEVKFPNVWDTGFHRVEFFMASDRIIVSDPAAQLRAWDDRGDERRAVTGVKYDRTEERYARLRFNWVIEKESVGVVKPTDTPTEKPGDIPDPVETEEPRDVGGKEQLFETDEERYEETVDNKIAKELSKLQGGDAGLWVWLAVLMSMFVWGAGHALMPGHGKTLVAAYLIGTRGKKSDALFLGLVVTAAHTSGVYLLLGGAWAIRTMWPGMLENPEKQLAEWISVAVGATILLMGVGLVLKRADGGHHEHDIFGRHVHPEDDHHHHGHDHGHSHGDHPHAHPHTHALDEKQPEDSDILTEVPHDHDHGHSHAHSHDHGHHHHGELDPGKMTRWEILRLGILGGILPCPSAFVIGLLAFQWQIEVTGLIAVLAFSVGLAAVLAGIGLIMVQSKEYLHKRTKDKQRGRFARLLEAKLPVIGALMITLIGTVILVFSLIRLGFVDPATFTI